MVSNRVGKGTLAHSDPSSDSSLHIFVYSVIFYAYTRAYVEPNEVAIFVSQNIGSFIWFNVMYMSFSLNG